MVLLSQAPFSPLPSQYFKVPCGSLLWPSGWKARTLFTLLCHRVPATVPKFRSKLKLVPTLQKVLSVVIYCYQEDRQTKKSRGFCHLFGTTDPLVRVSLEFLVPVGSCCYGYHCPPTPQSWTREFLPEIFLSTPVCTSGFWPAWKPSCGILEEKDKSTIDSGMLWIPVFFPNMSAAFHF